MLILDSFLLLIIIAILHLIKLKYPNFLFFCKGSILFLPPEEHAHIKKSKEQGEGEGGLDKTNRNTRWGNNKRVSKKQGAQQEQMQIKILQLEYRQVKQYPMADEYDRVIFLIAGLVIYIPLKYMICRIADGITGRAHSIQSSSFTFIICLVGLIYAIKLGLQIFRISSYSIKYCLLFGVGINVIFYMLFLSLNNVSGTYDKQLQYSILDYRKQLSIVVGKQISESSMNIKNILCIILLFNTVFTLISIPAVIKFGNWYTKTLKQIYYQDQNTNQIQDQNQKKQKQQKQLLLKQKSAKSIRLLNIYLICVLVFLFFSHSYIHNFLSSLLIDIVRMLLMIAITWINCYTLKDAIQFNGSFAYKFISEYLNTSPNNIDQRQRLRQKIVPYVYFIWYHKFQFMFRIIIPILLFMMLVDWKYMHSDSTPLQSHPIISQTHCGLQTNQLFILQNLYKCDPLTATTHIHQISQPLPNGMLIAGHQIDQLSVTQDRLARYGLLNPYFMAQLMEQLLWYSNISVYAMTIVYILFLRKTVYDI